MQCAKCGGSNMKPTGTKPIQWLYVVHAFTCSRCGATAKRIEAQADRSPLLYLASEAKRPFQPIS